MNYVAAPLIASTVLVAMALATSAFAAELPSRTVNPAPSASAQARPCAIDGMKGVLLPGTSTCVKIAGSVSAAVAAGSQSH